MPKIVQELIVFAQNRLAAILTVLTDIFVTVTKAHLIVCIHFLGSL